MHAKRVCHFLTLFPLVLAASTTPKFDQTKCSARQDIRWILDGFRIRHDCVDA